jgi:hypothetical protein
MNPNTFLTLVKWVMVIGAVVVTAFLIISFFV